MKKTLLRAVLAAALSLAAFLPGVASAETTAPPPPASSQASNAPAPTPAPAPAPTQAPAAAAKTVRARLLIDGEHGKANDVVSLPLDAAKEAEKAGLVDTNKAAVEYAAGLPQNQPKPKAQT